MEFLSGSFIVLMAVLSTDGFILTLLPRMAAGAIIPVLAKVFFWYGMSINKKTNQ
jgi:hypothetical protein